MYVCVCVCVRVCVCVMQLRASLNNCGCCVCIYMSTRWCKVCSYLGDLNSHHVNMLRVFRGLVDRIKIADDCLR